MTERLLVTGLDGFVGSSVRALLEREKSRHTLAVPRKTLELRDRMMLEAAIAETRPDCVLHLAAQSFVPIAVKDPLLTYEINFLGTLNLLEALKAQNFTGRFLYVSSGDVYGRVPPEVLPITEDQPVQPRNPYAVSKAAAELLCRQWALTQDFDIVIARPFNHVGPGQSPWFAISDFARQLAEIRLGSRAPEIRVGALDVTRDFTDVRDVVRAYLLLLEHGQHGETYNVCSGQERSVRDALNRLIQLSGVDCRIVEEAERARPGEQTRMCGSYDKLRRETDWWPAVDFDQSLQDILNDWERKLKNG